MNVTGADDARLVVDLAEWKVRLDALLLDVVGVELEDVGFL
jgi:hypothetical protein